MEIAVLNKVISLKSSNETQNQANHENEDNYSQILTNIGLSFTLLDGALIKLDGLKL